MSVVNVRHDGAGNIVPLDINPDVPIPRGTFNLPVGTALVLGAAPVSIVTDSTDRTATVSPFPNDSGQDYSPPVKVPAP